MYPSSEHHQFRDKCHTVKYLIYCAFFQSCESILSNENIWNAIKDSKYDLIILDGILACTYIFPYRLGVPYTTVAYAHDPWSAGVPAMPSVETSHAIMMHDPWKMTFTQRMINILYYVGRTIMVSRTFDAEYTKRYINIIILYNLSSLLPLGFISTSDDI